MKDKGKPSSPNTEVTNLENKADFENTDNRIPREIEEEFFPEPKKHPEQDYLE